MASTEEPARASYSTDPALYIYTSLTAGSSHIVTATSRLETILRANRVPFKALDLATDEKARMLWGRRAGKDESGRQRKLPALVQMGLVLGDLVEIEEWNEYGELKQHVTIYYDEFTQPSISEAQKLPPVMKKGPAVAAPTTASTATTTSKPAVAPAAPPLPPSSAASSSAPAAAKATGSAAASAALPIRSIAEEAAAKAKQVQLQSLRDKVYGKGNTGPVKKEDADKASKAEGSEKKEEAAKAPAAKKQDDSAKSEDIKDAAKSPAPITVPESSSTTAVKTAAGLQSPTSGAWKGSGEDASSVEALRNTIQSPTSTAWKPTDTGPAVTTHRGSVVSPASPEEIEAVEKELAIKEEPEEDEEDDDDEDEDSEEDEESKEPAKDKKVAEKAAAKAD
ncbi:hypothetical protein PpBr36_08624 [Pyricularia pennisetigena]|uniref:hypothetical protein n=1 Tax=Pyricularia pennisetigena TaxID=1578925 RepID=UPI00114D96DC|nr:hypothetical protein PpBr36_08624 [Pyricularia pennisetigena]TLS24725.1 hypothetical protein PpBr36_08624 [Pyricularia pennisetigena]